MEKPSIYILLYRLCDPKMLDVNEVQRLVKHQMTNFMPKTKQRIQILRTDIDRITLFGADIDRILMNRLNETCASMVEKCK